MYQCDQVPKNKGNSRDIDHKDDIEQLCSPLHEGWPEQRRALLVQVVQQRALLARVEVLRELEG